jgi:effector-binding domain-containing protein
MTYEIEIREYLPQQIATMRVAALPTQFDDKLHTALKNIRLFMSSQGIEISEPPLTVYHEVELIRMICDTGFPIHQPIETDGQITISQIPGGRAAVTHHTGSITFASLKPAHRAVIQWIEANGEKQSAPPREVYLTATTETTKDDECTIEIVWPLE